MVAFTILRVRDDFTRLRAGKAYRCDGFTLRALPASATLKEDRDSQCRVGITVSKHCSKKAVERNRIKRRLRAVIAEVWPIHAAAGYDYVLIARIEALALPYERLRHDAQRSLKKLHTPQG